MEKETAIITGADGGMGQEITLALAKSGFRIIMACKEPKEALPICERIKKDSGNEEIEVRKIDFTSLASVRAFAQEILSEGHPIHRLMNNAGLLTTRVRPTEDALEPIVSVNYVGPYLLTRLLLPLMHEGTRIVNTVSCTYAIGKIESEFFTKGRNGCFNRILVYANTKLALLLFTRELAKRVHEKGITVNASDPGVVSTNIIRMDAWFDPLTDIFFRPFIRTPLQGAATAIHLALSDKVEGKSGHCYASCKQRKLSERIANHPMQGKLWDDTESLLHSRGLL